MSAVAAPLVTSHKWRPYSHSQLRTIHGERACAFMHCHLSRQAHADGVSGKRGGLRPRPA